jgi:protein phosphatase-4 regulatory subunit 3
MEESSSTAEETKSEPTIERNVMRRVKLYYLNDDGKWDDKGTGHVACTKLKVCLHAKLLKQKDEMHLLMVSEDEDDARLLCSKISHDDIYQLQGGIKINLSVG